MTGATVGTGQSAGSAAVRLVRMKQSVLTRYRAMAYITAVMLLVLCTCMVFKYGFDTGKQRGKQQTHQRQ